MPRVFPFVRPRNGTGPRSWVLVIGAMFAVAACGEGSACPAGEQRICKDASDCRCGPPCNSQDDCSGLQICAKFAGEPLAPGVCVDALWLLDNPPCLPLCRDAQVCVAYDGQPNGCYALCENDSECGGGCCVTLSNGQRSCAPESVCAQRGCDPACADTETCVLFGTEASCAPSCLGDSDCSESCCVPLENGTGVCSPDRSFCPTDPPPPCRTLEACTRVETRFTAAEAGGCGTAGSYDGALLNACGESAECRACWFSADTGAYTDCVALGEIPSGATVPIGETRCANASLPEPAVKVRCIDSFSHQSGNDCLGSGPL